VHIERPRIEERREGEPVRRRPPVPVFLVMMTALTGFTLVKLAAGVLTWPLFLLGVAIWGWPPHLVRLPMAWQHFRRTLTVQPPFPGLPPLSRLWLLLRIFSKVAGLPMSGLAWFLDELLFGRTLSATPVDAPLLMLSAARSGSTQMGHYLEEDPELCAPVMLQIVFPHLWLWKLVVPTLGRLVSDEWLAARFDAAIPLEMKQRHEGHPLRTDTFDVLFLVHGTHLLSAMSGLQPMCDDIPFMGTADHNRGVWDVDFVRFMVRLGRKTVHFAGPAPDGRPRRLFVKGHFLESRDALARHWPKAHFLTTVRDPVKRLESMVNHLHANAVEEALGAPPWNWIAPFLEEAEAHYCEVEQVWFTQDDGVQRTVIRFSDYVDDLEGTMRLVYRRCLGHAELPPHVPTEHPPRERKNYLVHRTLEDLHIDRSAFATRMAAYAEWAKG